MNKFLFLLLSLLLPCCLLAQDDILEKAIRTNDYFMAKYADPTEPTNVKRIRPSNLWTRAVYYEGLMALNDLGAGTKIYRLYRPLGKFPQVDTALRHSHNSCRRSVLCPDLS